MDLFFLITLDFLIILHLHRKWSFIRYGPNEGNEDGEKFWNDFNRIVDILGNGYRLCVVGDLSGWNGDRVRTGVTGAFGAPRENQRSSFVLREVMCG